MRSQSSTRADVSEIVQELLEVTGWTETELAVRVSANQPTVNRWKMGKNTASQAQRKALLTLLDEERRKREVPNGTRLRLVTGGEIAVAAVAAAAGLSGSETDDPWQASVQQLMTIYAVNASDPRMRKLLDRWKHMLREQIDLIAETTAPSHGHARAARKREPVDD